MELLSATELNICSWKLDTVQLIKRQNVLRKKTFVWPIRGDINPNGSLMQPCNKSAELNRKAQSS